MLSNIQSCEQTDLSLKRKGKKHDYISNTTQQNIILLYTSYNPSYEESLFGFVDVRIKFPFYIFFWNEITIKIFMSLNSTFNIQSIDKIFQHEHVLHLRKHAVVTGTKSILETV